MLLHFLIYGTRLPVMRFIIAYEYCGVVYELGRAATLAAAQILASVMALTHPDILTFDLPLLVYDQDNEAAGNLIDVERYALYD